MSEQKKNTQNSKNSLLPLYLYKILREESSNTTPLTRTEIDAKLRKCGIEIGENDRKKTTRWIKTFSEHFDDCDIVQSKKRIKDINEKWTTVDAWYLKSTHTTSFGNNVFLPEEATMLIDMMWASKLVSDKASSAMINKIVRSLNVEDKNKLVITKYQKGPYKKDSSHSHKITNKIEQAMNYYRELTITYSTDDGEKRYTVIPHDIELDDELYLNAFNRGKTDKFLISKITDATIGKEADLAIYQDDEVDLEPEGAEDFRNIALDSLFSNIREINSAIKSKQKITFKYLAYTIENDKIAFKPSTTKTIFPINTVYKDSVYYLICVDVEANFTPAFFRIDLMENLELAGQLDFMERRKFDTEEPHEYTDAHPYMLSGFSKRTVEFAIRKDSLDRVVNAFGNKAKYLGDKKGFELGSTNVKKLSNAWPELNFSTHLGLDHNGTYCVFKVQTTDEEIKRFALEHADVVELTSPKYLREEIEVLAEKLVKRYSKKND